MHKHLNTKIAISEIEGADKFIAIAQRKPSININTFSAAAIKESLLEFKRTIV